MAKRFLTKSERELFAEGRWQTAYTRLGAHKAEVNGQEGYAFAVWAPGAKSVRVTGQFCGWDPERHVMLPTNTEGVWHLFVPGTRTGDTYKFVVETSEGALLYKADPFAFSAQQPPETASRLFDPGAYPWGDGAWMRGRRRRDPRSGPLNLYEVHPGSWRRNEDGSFLTYDQLADSLIPYALEMGYTHLELMPVMEHPYDGSWGYQLTGYFAPTARFGPPDRFLAFIDRCHQAGLGVVLDWVPGHFCRDQHGLGVFTGEKLYEKDDHVQWGTYRFDFGRGEVRSFLLSSARFWLDVCHADGLRVDGVTSMLLRDFGASSGQVSEGGREDPDAAAFLRDLNALLEESCPGALRIAEESGAYPLVTHPPEEGGLGFHFKWDMGWMHDTLRYMQADFPFRPGVHELLTFSMTYAFDDRFLLALSHDEVVHGKGSLIGRMPGDYWRQFAGLRALALYQAAHPGPMLTFMGGEIAQFVEWRYYEALEWFLLDYETHRKHRAYIRALNLLYQRERALWLRDDGWEGFSWLDPDDRNQSALFFLRRARRPMDELVVLFFFTPRVWDEFRVGVPRKGVYEEIFSSDREEYGGSGRVNPGYLVSEPVPWHGQPWSVVLRTPPLGGTILKRVGKKALQKKD